MITSFSFLIRINYYCIGSMHSSPLSIHNVCAIENGCRKVVIILYYDGSPTFWPLSLFRMARSGWLIFNGDSKWRLYFCYCAVLTDCIFFQRHWRWRREYMLFRGKMNARENYLEMLATDRIFIEQNKYIHVKEVSCNGVNVFKIQSKYWELWEKKIAKTIKTTEVLWNQCVFVI